MLRPRSRQCGQGRYWRRFSALLHGFGWGCRGANSAAGRAGGGVDGSVGQSDRGEGGLATGGSMIMQSEAWAGFLLAWREGGRVCPERGIKGIMQDPLRLDGLACYQRKSASSDALSRASIQVRHCSLHSFQVKISPSQMGGSLATSWMNSAGEYCSPL